MFTASACRIESRGSLADLDCLPESFPHCHELLTMQYIHSNCDIPQPSEQLDYEVRINHDGFRNEMEGLAFGKQQVKLQLSQPDETLELDNVSTSMNSQEPTPTAVPETCQTPKKGGCTCKKTGCLKLYCECFSSGRVCGAECGCHNCLNHCENEQLIARSRQVAKHRFRQAYFNPLDGGIKKRCHCKKTQCRKKYCECFNMGLPCNELCKCQGCENGTHSHSHQHQPNPELLLC